MFYSLMTGLTDRVVKKLLKGHDESIRHFRNVESELLKGIRNAEIEFLKGVRTVIDEGIQFVDGWLEKQNQSTKES